MSKRLGKVTVHVARKPAVPNKLCLTLLALLFFTSLIIYFVLVFVVLFVFESIVVQQYDYGISFKSQVLQCNESYVFVISSN